MATITAKIKKGVQTLLDQGADRNKIEGYLLFEEVEKKEALGYMKELGLIGRKSFRQWMTAKCLDGFLSFDEFSKELEGNGTDNEKRHMKTFNNEREAYNAIHAKYDSKIAELVKKEKEPAKAE